MIVAKRSIFLLIHMPAKLTGQNVCIKNQPSWYLRPDWTNYELLLVRF